MPFDRGDVVLVLFPDSNLQTGLHTDSVIMTDNLATVLDVEVDRVLGSWPDVTSVDAALRHTLGL